MMQLPKTNGLGFMRHWLGFRLGRGETGPEFYLTKAAESPAFFKTQG